MASNGKGSWISNMKQIEVVAAIIHDGEGRIFATQRGYGDYKDGWDPASEDDMDDNGMQRYFDANDDEAWD